MCLDCMDGAYEADEECRSQYNCCSFEETLADDDDDDYDDGDDHSDHDVDGDDHDSDVGDNVNIDFDDGKRWH